MVLTFDSVDAILKCDHLNESTQKQRFVVALGVALFIILYLLVLTFESVDEIVKCDHSKESY